MKIWMTIAFLLAFHATHAAEPRDSALKRLVSVERFAFGGVGYAGVMSPGERDYKVILSGPSPLADFEKLYHSGNLQAKLYALVGIRKLSPVRFKELASPLRGSKEEVSVMSGCIISRQPLEKLVERIDAGDYSR